MARDSGLNRNGESSHTLLARSHLRAVVSSHSPQTGQVVVTGTLLWANILLTGRISCRLRHRNILSLLGHECAISVSIYPHYTRFHSIVHGPHYGLDFVAYTALQITYANLTENLPFGVTLQIRSSN